MSLRLGHCEPELPPVSQEAAPRGPSQASPLESTHHVCGVRGTKKHRGLHPHLASNVLGQEVISKIIKNTLNAQRVDMTDSHVMRRPWGQELTRGREQWARPHRWESVSHT